MIYDPRESTEDEAVKAQAEDYMKLLSEPTLKKALNISTGGVSLDTSSKSEDEIGLQIADIVAGEVRRFFRYNHELLTFGSSLTFVSSESEDELECFSPICGSLLKSGRFIRTPKRIQKQHFDANEQVFLPYLQNSIMSGALCCVTEFGQERVVRIFQGLLFDLCD